MVKVIVVDDELKSLKTLVMMLKEYCPMVEVVAEAKSALEGIKEINIHKPDIVFLDIAEFSLQQFQKLAQRLRSAPEPT